MSMVLDRQHRARAHRALDACRAALAQLADPEPTPVLLMEAASVLERAAPEFQALAEGEDGKWTAETVRLIAELAAAKAWTLKARATSAGLRWTQPPSAALTAHLHWTINKGYFRLTAWERSWCPARETEEAQNAPR